jgi:wyosine [tRNA(Phe)-imidazoG37] synthetase (radical SAM superfamily)
MVIPKGEQDKFDSLSEKMLVPLIEHAEKVSICGSGDPFASMHFRNLLIDYCKNTQDKTRKLALQTNALLCDKKAWDSIGLYGHVQRVAVSIDAAHEDTYNIVRRGGNFKRVHENMRFLSDLHQAGEFNRLLTCFVVQMENFREMAEFVHQSKAWGVTCVEFSQIRNWGTFSPEEFARQNVASRDHPMHHELLEMLKDPIFESSFVNLGDLGNIQQKN